MPECKLQPKNVYGLEPGTIKTIAGVVGLMLTQQKIWRLGIWSNDTFSNTILTISTIFNESLRLAPICNV
jgi:hypothetical protein